MTSAAAKRLMRSSRSDTTEHLRGRAGHPAGQGCHGGRSSPLPLSPRRAEPIAASRGERAQRRAQSLAAARRPERWPERGRSRRGFAQGKRQGEPVTRPVTASRKAILPRAFERIVSDSVHDLSAVAPVDQVPVLVAGDELLRRQPAPTRDHVAGPLLFRRKLLANSDLQTLAKKLPLACAQASIWRLRSSACSSAARSFSTFRISRTR